MDVFQETPETLGDGRYVVGPLIRTGTMSSVFRGTDTKTGDTVALKILEGGFADVTVRKRFLAEIRALSENPHPRIVPILGAGRDGAIVWFAMQYCPGGSLRDKLDEGTLPTPRMAARWTIELLDGLEVVHRAGLIHRDVKPSNLLLDEDGRVRVADFGVARHPGGKVAFKTMQGQRIGSGPYLAPEVREDGSAVTVQSDIYAAGATLFELLAGRAPVKLALAERREDDLLAVPSEFANAIRTATALERDERYTSAKLMREVVVHACDTWSKAHGEPQDARSWCYRDPMDSGLLNWVRKLVGADE